MNLIQWRAIYKLVGSIKYGDFFYFFGGGGQLRNSWFLKKGLHHGVSYFYVLQYLNQRENSSWYKGVLCKPKVFQKQIGHQAVETKII